MTGDDGDPSSPEVGRAASWATKFERLLADPIGVAMFRDFLQKEFRYVRGMSVGVGRNGSFFWRRTPHVNTFRGTEAILEFYPGS